MKDFELTAAEQVQYPIDVLCAVLAVSRAGCVNQGRRQSMGATRDEASSKHIG